MIHSREVFGNPIAPPVFVNLVGKRWWIIAIAAGAICVGTISIGAQLSRHNKLKEQEIELLRQQINVAQRQYTLDSLKYYGNQK